MTPRGMAGTRPVRRLGALGDGDRAAVGEKAWQLDRLIRAGFLVPPGVVVTAPALWQAVRSAGLEQAANERLRGGINNSGVLRSLLWTVDQTEIGRELADALGGLPGPFAVRSSSTLEDRADSSMAGLFTSILDVPRDGLLGAVQQVWTSGYAPLVLALATDLPAAHQAVIVQVQVAPRAAGVCFSADPLDGRPDPLLIDCVEGRADRLLGGERSGTRYAVARQGQAVSGPADGPLRPGDAHAIRDAVLAVESLFATPVDVEFALVDGAERPYILQARPVTTGVADPVRPDRDGIRLAAVDDLARARALATGHLTDLVQKRADKRSYVRSAAREHEIHVGEEWLLAPVDGRPRDATIAALTRAVLDLAGTDVVELGLPRPPVRRVRREDVAGTLAERYRPGDTVFVAEVDVGVASGYAAVGPAGSVVIEYLPGAAGGLMYGAGPFSVLVVADQGRRIVDERRAASSFWAMDPVTLQIGECRGPRTPDPLDDAAVAEIRRITEVMRSRFGEVRVEWIRLASGEIRLWDLSVEGGTPLPDRSAGVISPGSARSRAVVLTDLSDLERIAADRSVVPDREFLAAYRGSEADAVRTRLLAGAEHPIVVTPWPKTTLALLVGHVAGFVFDDAATLCHLAIILREARVPAIVSPGSTRRVRSGDLVELVDGDCRVLP